MKRGLAVALALAAGVLAAFRSTVAGDGVPSFRHDWSWPATSQAFRWGTGVETVWNPNGIGSPYVRITDHPALRIIHWLSAFVDAKTLLILLIATCVLSIGLGTYCFACRLGADSLSAAAAAAACALGPPCFNKFLAGQYYYWIAMAAIPWIVFLLWSDEREKRWGRVMLAGVLVSWTAIQPQLWACAIVFAAVLISLRSPRERRLFENVLVLGVGSLLMIPAIMGSIFAHSAGDLSFQRPIPFYEANNSVAFWSAPIGLGYSSGYAETAYAAARAVPGAFYALWIVPVLAISSVRFRDASVGALAGVWIVLVILMQGVYGPLSAAMSWTFSHVYAAAVFRELYHFAWPAWMLACALAARATRGMPMILSRTLWSAACIAVAILWIPANYGEQLHSYPQSQRVLASQRTIAAAPGNDRYALLPGIAPVGPAGATDAGVDRDAFPAGEHAVANVQEMPYPLAAALAEAGTSGAPAKAWLQAFGIGYTIDRPDIISARSYDTPITPAQRNVVAALTFRGDDSVRSTYAPTSLAFAAQSVSVVEDPFTSTFDDGFIWAGDDVTSDWSSFVYPRVDESHWNAFDGWTLARFWYWVDPHLALWPKAIVTFGRHPFRIDHRSRYVYILTSAASLRIGDENVRVTPRKLTLLRLPPRVSSVSGTGGFTEIVGFANTLPRAAQAGLSRSEDTLIYDDRCACATGHVSANDRWVVLKESYDPQWVLHLRRGNVVAHLLYSRYGNAWMIRPAKRGDSVFIAYAPAWWWQPLVDWSLVAWMIVALATLAFASAAIANAVRSRPFA